MKRNPIVPYLLIIALGIGIIFFLSLNGNNKKNEAKNETPKTEQPAKSNTASEVDAKAITTAKCISCHGNDLKGGVGPSLHATGLKAKDVEKILRDGQLAMPAGLLTSDEEITAVGKYIEGLK